VLIPDNGAQIMVTLRCFDLTFVIIRHLMVIWLLVCGVVEGAFGVGIFHKLTFTLIGFDGDAYQPLADMIRDNGGEFLTTAISIVLHLMDDG